MFGFTHCDREGDTMNKDILSLSGEELDALVAEKVMGWKVTRKHGKGSLGFNPPVEQCEIFASESNGPTHWITPASWSGNVPIFQPSRRAEGMELVLDYMIALGWEPMFRHNDYGWHVSFTKDGMSTITDSIRDLKEAVCKCSLLAVGGVDMDDVIAHFLRRKGDILSSTLEQVDVFKSFGLAPGLELSSSIFETEKQTLIERCKDSRNSKFYECVHGLAEVGEYILERFLEEKSHSRAEQLLTWLDNSGDSVVLYSRLGV